MNILVFIFYLLPFEQLGDNNNTDRNLVFYVIDSISTTSTYMVELNEKEIKHRIYFYDCELNQIDSVLKRNNYNFEHLLDKGYPYYTVTPLYLFFKHSDTGTEKEIPIVEKYKEILDERVYRGSVDTSISNGNSNINIYKIDCNNFLIGVINKKFVESDFDYRIDLAGTDEQLVYIAFPNKCSTN